MAQSNFIKVLRHREARLLHGGQTISGLGDGIATITFALIVLQQTHSAAALGWFVTARMVPLVAFLLVGGSIVDRFSRRRLVMISDAGRGTIALILTVGLLTGHATYTWMIVLGIGFGLFDALFMPAITALIPEIVEGELLLAMNGIRSLSNQLAMSLVGPALGGLIANYSFTLAVGIDAATFGVAWLAALTMRPTPTPQSVSAHSLRRDLREGWRFMRATSWFRTTILAVSVGNAFLFTPSIIIVTYLIRHQFHESKTTLGLVEACAGISGVLAGLWVAHMKMPRSRYRSMWTYWFVANFVFALFAFATNYWWVIGIGLAGAPLLLIGNAIWESLMQAEVPPAFMGRASSIDWFFSLGLAPVGTAVAGIAIDHVGVTTYVLVALMASVVTSLFALFSPSSRTVDIGRHAD